MWTDEKHSLFLEKLEVSFVKQLHQSIILSARYSDQDEEGDRRVARIQQIDARDTSEQLAAPLHGCWEKIKCNRGDPFPHVSVESLGHIKSPREYQSKRIRVECPAAAAAARIPEPLMLCNAENSGKVVKHYKSDTCSQQFSASTEYCDSQDSTREGTGQNFGDEDDESHSDTASRVKRLKRVSPY